ncbi:uncharacterized protein B0J16DRAFT_393692 [Fusarium flagelliforme]|uniref:uncharacterized protein n=1 Tax=Fusarium flagelliforme TaxID=2675880 RepID=UPI001E8DE874|nr:uncharacterized protein B0J16DRAFT_393692 [Fusarium flagelliforme]KAH7191731.1 hypothetical protein B0J16DRAFT_393692 [Fusarium flagelliforme]
MAEKPDVTVAIDFGTTFTSTIPQHPVAFLLSNGTIHCFNNWPGNKNSGETKVPSRLVYNHDNTVSSWGFSSSIYDDPLPIGKKEYPYFKMFLDEETCEEMRIAGQSSIRSTTEAARCVTDYLQQIYRHIKITYEEMTGANWASSAVVFLFSVPTTWKGLDASNTLKAAIRAAGFGTEGPRHSAQIDLTEAEAAAVDTLKNGLVKFSTGDVFLIVDAGGGTTDFSLVQVTSVHKGRAQMSQIAEVGGIGIGSTLIDFSFRKLVEERLAKCPDVPFYITNGLAETMMNSQHFKRVKHLFGDPAAIAQSYRILMPGVPNNFRHARLRAEAGYMLFDRSEIQSLFDPHVERILAGVRGQLAWMVQQGRTEQVFCRENWAVPNMSKGGLGSISVNSATQTLRILRGLLENQQRKLEDPGIPVIATYVARVSYGVVRREKYDPTVHIGAQLEPDRFDTALQWADGQIEWLIRKGDNIDSTKPIMTSFSKRLHPGESTISVTTQIVASTSELNWLPQSLLKAGVKKLCQVQCTLTDLEPEELVLVQKRGWRFFRKGYKYYECNFDVHLLVSAADLRFELWFKDKKFSRGHEPIKVKWN